MHRRSRESQRRDTLYTKRPVPALTALAAAYTGDDETARHYERLADEVATEGYDFVLAAPRTWLALLRGELDRLDRLGVHTPNRSGFPIIEVPLARHEDIDAVGRFLFDNGIYVTLAAYPLVPRSEVGFRIQVTAANSDAEIEQLTDVLGRLVNVFDLQPARKRERAA